MNKITFFTVIMFTATIMVWAQSPEVINYQAVVRTSSGDIIANGTAVQLRFTIHDSTATGSSVFTETITDTANQFGLINTAIGSTASLSSVNWAVGTKFLQVEADVDGGGFVDMGTTQLLSVPYALYANTANTANIADSITGGIVEADPVFGVSIAAGITGGDTTNWNNKQEQLTSGTGIDITNNVVSATTYNVGDFAHGGIVFWVDETGQHGLVCAKENQSAGLVKWYAGSQGDTQAKGDGPLAGKANTAIIIAAFVALGDDGSAYAARICNEAQITEGGKTYGDWYLPSKHELHLMYLNRSVINTTATSNGGSAFNSAVYWSSTENSTLQAWAENMGASLQVALSKNNSYWVRAVRAF